MAKELAKAFSMIADLLPRTDFTLVHYPTSAMKEMIAQLYAQILLFTSQAIRWYKKGKLSHAIGAIARPWALNWKENVDGISELSRRIESLARIAAQAELRDTRLEVKSLRSEVKEMAHASKEAHESISRRLERMSANDERTYEVAYSTLLFTPTTCEINHTSSNTRAHSRYQAKFHDTEKGDHQRVSWACIATSMD